jgi:hypothetical protein
MPKLTRVAVEISVARAGASDRESTEKTRLA